MKRAHTRQTLPGQQQPGKRLARYLLVLAMLGGSFAAHAREPFNMDTLSELFNTYKRQQAYQYASQHLSGQEGDPYFDYFYGVSAIDSGFASQGVFALERVLLVFPDDPVARLELARGYFVLKEYARSRQEFEAVLASEPPESVKRTAYLYLDRIRIEESRYRTTWSGYVEVGGGVDSNVNSGPDDDFGFLVPSSTEKEDSFVNATGQVLVEHPFAPGWKVNAQGTIIAKKNMDLSEFDTFTGGLQTGLIRTSKSSQYNFDIIGQQFQLDGENYRQMIGTNLGWKYDVSEMSNFTTSVQYASLDYDIFPILDSELLTFNLGYTQQFQVQTSPVLFTNVRMGSELAKADDPIALANTERDFYSLQLGVAMSFSSSYVLQLNTNYQVSDFAGPNSLVSNNGFREDKFLTAGMNFLWLIDQDWRVDTRVSYSRNDSNINLREYNRTLASINLNYNF